MPNRSRLLLIAALLALCAWLGAELNDQLNAQPTARVAATPKTVTGGPKIQVAALDGQPFRMPPMAELTEMVERPLFFKDRKRPADEAPATGSAVAAARPAGKVLLTGVVISPGEKIALVRSTVTKEVVSLTIGQKIDSWKLEEIRPDRILIRFGDQVEEVMIEDNKAPRIVRKTGKTVRAGAKRNRLTPQQLRRARAKNRANRRPGRKTN